MWFLRHHRSYYKQRSVDIAREEKNWEIERENIKRQNKIKNEYNRLSKKDPYKITTGKLILWLFLILCIIIIIFTGFITVQELALAIMLGQMPNFTPLVTMIGTVASLAGTIAAYFSKSAKENTQGGITYEAAAANNFQREDNDLPVG